jgi:hypothetical protein
LSASSQALKFATPLYHARVKRTYHHGILYMYTRKFAQVVTDLQTSCNKVKRLTTIKPISGCVRTAFFQLL